MLQAGAWAFKGSAQFPAPYSVAFESIPNEPNQYRVSTTPNICGGGCTGTLDSDRIFTMTAGFKLSATLSSDFLSLTWSNGAVWSRPRPCDGIGTITVSGPAAAWFGVGFGATAMKNTYAVIVSGQGTDVSVQERSLGDHDPGQPLAASIRLLNHTVSQGIRTVVLERPLQGTTDAHFSFNAEAAGVDVITGQTQVNHR